MFLCCLAEKADGRDAFLSLRFLLSESPCKRLSHETFSGVNGVPKTEAVVLFRQQPLLFCNTPGGSSFTKVTVRAYLRRRRAAMPASASRLSVVVAGSGTAFAFVLVALITN